MYSELSSRNPRRTFRSAPRYAASHRKVPLPYPGASARKDGKTESRYRNTDCSHRCAVNIERHGDTVDHQIGFFLFQCISTLSGDGELLQQVLHRCDRIWCIGFQRVRIHMTYRFSGRICGYIQQPERMLSGSFRPAVHDGCDGRLCSKSKRIRNCSHLPRL